MIHLIDTHAHLYWDSFKEDFDGALKRAEGAGVTTIINVGVDVPLSKVAAKLGSTNPNVKFYSTIGIHPHEAAKYLDGSKQFTDDRLEQDIQALEEIYKQNPGIVVAVGECGLDFNFEEEFIPEGVIIEQLKDAQKKLFQAQIDLAKKLDLPLIVHCRDDRSKNPENSECWDEVLDMASDHFGIFHCYSGLSATTYKILNTKYLISFAAILTYPKNEYLREAIKTLPLNKMVLETDCPFLPPQSRRGQRNEPATVRELAELVAQLKGTSLDEISKQTTENTKRLLNLN